MPLYFAYGASMERAVLAARCPGSVSLGTARLLRHRLVITRDGQPSVTRDPRRSVWGLLWDVALADVPAIDRLEEFGSGLKAKTQQPVVSGAGPRRALLYVGRNAGPGRPPPGCIDRMLAAAREAGLPDAYLRDVGALAPGATRESPVDRSPSQAGANAPSWRPAVTPTRATPFDPVPDPNARWVWRP